MGAFFFFFDTYYLHTGHERWSERYKNESKALRIHAGKIQGIVCRVAERREIRTNHNARDREKRRKVTREMEHTINTTKKRQ